MISFCPYTHIFEPSFSDSYNLNTPSPCCFFRPFVLTLPANFLIFTFLIFVLSPLGWLRSMTPNPVSSIIFYEQIIFNLGIFEFFPHFQENN